MAYDRISFAGRLLDSQKKGLAGAKIELIDPISKSVVASGISGTEGQYRLEIKRADDPSLFDRVAKIKVTLQAVGANGRSLAHRHRLSCQPGAACLTDLRLSSRAAKQFKPVFSLVERLSGSVLDPQGLAIIDNAISGMWPIGTAGRNHYLKAARCPLPDLGVFENLLDEAWRVIDGDPAAERRFRNTLNLIGERLPVSRGGALPERGVELFKFAGFDERAVKNLSFGNPSNQLFSSVKPSNAQPLEASIPNPDSPLRAAHPCLTPPPRLVPPYMAAVMISHSFSDAAYLFGTLEHGLCGLDKMRGMLDASITSLASGNFQGLKGMLDHFSGECGPDDGPLPPFPEPHPNPECPEPPQPPDLLPDPCEVERLDCIQQIIRNIGRLTGSGLRYNITSISPIDACPGDIVTIVGINFGSVPGQVCFPFGSSSSGGTCVTALSWTDTEIRVVVPAGAGSGELYLKIVEDRIEICGKIFEIGRRGGGATTFTGGRAAVSSLRVDGRSNNVWAEPNTDVEVSWVASRGGTGTSVQIRITEGATVYLDQPGLPDAGTLTFRTPNTMREQTLRITAMATHPCGNDTRTLDLLVTIESELSITGIEVTQATQFYRASQHLPAGTFQADNTVPLIESKRTLVRVYIDSGLDGFDLGSGVGVVPGVTGRLSGWRGTTTLPGSPIASLNGPINVSRNAPYLNMRQQWDNTLNFELPSSWRNGTINLHVDIDSGFTLRHRHSGTIFLDTNIRFVSSRPLKLVGVMIRYTGWQDNAAGNRVRANIGAPNFSTLVNAASWLRRTYPINTIQFFSPPGNETITFDGDLTDGTGGGCGDEWGDLMDDLRDLASDYSGDDDAVWVGVLPSGWLGAAWGGCGGGTSDAIGAAVIFSSDTGPTLAQEVGHGYDRNHAPGCGAGNPDPSYPGYGKTSMASIGAFGVDWPTPGSSQWQIKDPSSANDFMSYCGSDWVSPYTYQALFIGGISPSSPLPAGSHDHDAHAISPGDPEVDTLALRGRIWKTGQVALKPSFHFRRVSKQPIGRKSGYSIEFRDGEGRSLEARPIIISESGTPQEQAIINFSISLPFSPKYRELVILKGEECIHRQSFLAKPPTLTNLTVNKTKTSRLEITWQANAKCDKLWHKIRYSADDGKTWIAAQRLLNTPKAELNLKKFPGGNKCLIEVYSSDGVATGRLRSKTFQVEHKPPRAIIASPEANKKYKDGAIRLIGTGLDEAGQAISKDRLTWHSSKDGPLGIGDLIEVQLSNGRHRIELLAKDERGAEDKEAVRIVIMRRKGRK